MSSHIYEHTMRRHVSIPNRMCVSASLPSAQTTVPLLVPPLSPPVVSVVVVVVDVVVVW